MIERWFEPFTLLEETAVPDGQGGQQTGFREATAFQGALVFTPGKEITLAEQTIPAEAMALLHEFDVTLSPGDYVRREKNGAIYRVKTHSGGMCAPAFSGLRFAQVDVERLVIPC